MAVRDFPDGAGITLAPGNAAALPTGAWTIAVITKPMALNTFRVVVAVGSAIADLGLWTTSSGGIQAVLNGFGRPIDLPLVENEWFLIAITKTAGVAIPRGHAYRYSTGTWTHLSATDTLEDKVSVSVIELGRTNNDWFYVGYIAVAGVWNTALSDTQIETLETSLQAWLDTGAVAVWPLNQTDISTPVVDITGGGADQTAQSGTTVVLDDDPPGFDFELGGGGGPVTVPVNVATETSSAFAVAKRKTKIVTNSIENSTALVVGRRKIDGLGLAVETSSVFTLDVVKRRAVGLATETNTVFPVTASFVQGFVVGAASETSTTFAIAKRKIKTFGRATETDVAFGVREPGRLDFATETDLALPVTWHKLRVVSEAVETGQAFGLSKTKVKTIGRTTEFNVAIFITTPEHVVGPYDIGVLIDERLEVRTDLHINVDVSVPKIVSEIRRHLSTSQ